MVDSKKVLAEAAKIGQKYLDAFHLDGKHDINVITAGLNKRTFEGEPVYAIVVESPDDVYPAIKKGLHHLLKGDKKLIKETLASLDPCGCIWDYYLMAFYDAAYSQCPDQSDEFGRQSFYNEFEAGLGFYINFGNFAIGVCLPKVHQDNQNRIHCESGPAITWGKSKRYFWHGVEVPEDWIEHKDKVKPSLGLTHRNIEQRRALCEILGWDKVLKAAKCRTISEDEMGELLEVDLPDAPGSKFVRVNCPTGRTFCLPVPQEMTTAHQAVAWTYNLDITNYEPEVRT